MTQEKGFLTADMGELEPTQFVTELARYGDFDTQAVLTMTQQEHDSLEHAAGQQAYRKQLEAMIRWIDDDVRAKRVSRQQVSHLVQQAMDEGVAERSFFSSLNHRYNALHNQ
tara:strand:+ start:170 stop:505 length:336 start_codon:yes stop_codon:yes gene_type:complete